MKLNKASAFAIGHAKKVFFRLFGLVANSANWTGHAKYRLKTQFNAAQYKTIIVIR